MASTTYIDYISPKNILGVYIPSIIAIKNNDVNFIFSSRWYDSDGKLKTDVAIKDLNRIFNGDKIESKYANEAAAKRLEAKIKADLNLNLGKQPQGTFNPDNSNIQQRQFDAIWDA